jgi:hypothetical protein
MDVGRSVHGVSVRLSYERWYHIVENHDDLASAFHDVLDTLEKPDFVLRGNHGTCKAVRSMGRQKWLIVIYREVSKRDGFVITAYFLARRPKGEVVWQS